MPLVRLEVENFKSYRGKQIIGPFRSFNSVIGPNGSGKSNLMDAISFVLGVKSSQLRSSQLKQLIYRGKRLQGSGDGEGIEQAMDVDEDGEEDAADDDAGTSKTASAQRATVVAVYEDNNGGEHRFQRTVNATGVSEYRVNGRAMNAGAYNDKLKAFNILVKAKNFLVFQGDVEAVAAQNPKDLSRLIDQISGSLEHKEAYDAARTAQTKTHEQLNHAATKRRNIMVELRHFRDQIGEADRYTRLQRDKHKHTIRNMLYSLYHAERSIKELTAAIARKNETLNEQRSKLAEAENAVNEKRQAHGQAMQAILEQQGSIKKRESEAEKIQPNVDALEQKASYSQKCVDDAQKNVAPVEMDIEKLTRSIDGYKGDLARVEEAAQLAAEEQARLSAKGGLNLTDADRAQYYELRAEASLRKHAERQSLADVKRQLRAKEATLQSLKDKLIALESQSQKLDEEIGLYQDTHDKASSRRREVQKRLTAARDAEAAARKQLEDISHREKALNDSLAVSLKKIREANDYQQENKRQSDMREAIKEMQSLFSGVLGRVSDLCRPTQRKYELAVSTVLGKNADAIIVETQKAAIDCVGHLKSNQKFKDVGQVTFIPLQTVQVKDLNERLRSIAPGARLAFDIIEFDASIEWALRYACGNALVCDTVDIARDVCYVKKQQVKAVALDGTVIHKSGLMSGGRTSEPMQAHWEPREIEALRREQNKSLDELKQLSKLRHDLQRDNANIDEIARHEAELPALEDELSASTKKLQGLKAEKEVVERQIAEMRPEVVASQQTCDALNEEIARLQDTVSVEDDEVFAQFCLRIGVANIREYEERHASLAEKQEDVRRQYELQKKRLQHTISFDEKRLTEARTRRDKNAAAIEKHRARVQEFDRERDDLKAKLEAIRDEVEAMRAELEAAQSEEAEKKTAYKEAKREAESLRKEIETLNRDVISTTTEIEHLGSQRRAHFRTCRLEAIELPLLAGSVDDAPIDAEDSTLGIDNTIRSDDSMDEDDLAISGPDYGIRVDYSTLTEAEKRDGSEGMRRHLRERLEETTLELERVAAPNARVQERLEDSESRLSDAEAEFERARRDNKRAQEDFTRLRKIRCDLYHRAFEHISTKVEEVYRDLTSSKQAPNGGSAYLDVRNDSEPYLDGVNFTAMPPTKSFRGIDQLSGGEKSVAALALLFAIHSYRPAPFFVLDEVDAALDSQNVARVAAYIRAHASKEFQFIVISLKAMLYERSEALLGVMRDQEINSSKTLTLDLEQYA